MTQPAASSSAAGLPATIDVLAAELVALYAVAEEQLIADMSRLSHRPQAVMLAAMRAEATRISTALRLRSFPLAQQIATIAAERGQASAALELRRMVQGSTRIAKLLVTAPSGTAPANAIGLDLALRLDSTIPGILRFADDAYRAATVGAVFASAVDGVSPALAQQRAWRELTQRGITGFTDRAGRKWTLASYVEMATRTGIQRAYNAAHLDRMTSVGIDQFTVTDDGHPCPLCEPWQGRVLTRNGPGPTIDDATEAGLFHPNCRHTLVAYFPGITRARPPSPWTQADQARYDATQRLRALEREVRAHKRVAAGARTPLDARRAQAQVRATQARIRAHVEQHGLVRRRRREQLDLGNR